MGCPPKCGRSLNDTSGIGRSPARRFVDPQNVTPQMIRSPSPSPTRALQNRPAERYDSFQRAVRNSRGNTTGGPLSSTMYSDQGGQYQSMTAPLSSTMYSGQGGSQYPSMEMSMDISGISARSASPSRPPQASTYLASPPRRDVSPGYPQISERPSRTIHSSTITKGPGRETVVQEVKEIFDGTPTRRQPQYPGNRTYDVAPLSNSRQVSFNPPASSTIYGQSTLDSSGSPYLTSTGYTSDATYTKPTQFPRSTFVVPRQYRDMSHVSPKSLYDTRTYSDQYDSSGSPYDTRTFSEEMTEIYDSSDEIDDSLLGKILRGEIGRNIQPMTPSDPKDATFTKANATYSVMPMQSESSIECGCSDPDASSSFNPPATSTGKKQVKSSIEVELSRREHEERMQLEQDLYRWQQARRKLVLDSSLSGYSS